MSFDNDPLWRLRHALAGLGLALVCWYRSLAHAVYAHTLFDLYVLVVR